MCPGDFTGREPATTISGVFVSMFVLINMIACATPYRWFHACIMHLYSIYSVAWPCYDSLGTVVCDTGRDQRDHQEPRQQAPAEQEKPVPPSSREERPRAPTLPAKKRLRSRSSMTDVIKREKDISRPQFSDCQRKTFRDTLLIALLFAHLQ